jgi:hypothetical protein
MTLRPDEERCARALERWLLERGRPCLWTPGADPPDLDFTVETRRWAVEVSGLHKYFPEHAAEASRPSASAAIQELARKLDREVNAPPGVLYVLWVQGPLSGEEIRSLERSAAAYLRSGRTDRQMFDSMGRTGMWVLPVKSWGPTRVVASHVLDPLLRSGTRDANIADNNVRLQFALNRMLDRKIPTLAGLHDWDCRVLMIHSGEYFATPEAVGDALKSMVGVGDHIDGIFLKDMQGNVHVVFETGLLLGLTMTTPLLE